MKFKFLQAASVSLVLSVCNLANAGLIVDNGTDIVNIGGSCSSCGTSFQAFDDFTLSQDYNLDYLDIDFSTLNYDNVEFSIWNNTLSEKLFSYNYSWAAGTFITNVNPGFNNVTVTLDLGSSSLTAGTYYLSLLGTDTYVMLSGTGTHLQFSTAGLSDYSTQTGWEMTSDLHFRLYSETTEVPEPSTLAIFALGIMGLAARRFKK